MTATVVELARAQTTADPGVLVATFTGTPQAGDRALLLVALRPGIVSSNQVAVSGLGASWRLVQEVMEGTFGRWYGVYEASGLDAVGKAVTVSESSSVSNAAFAITCFLIRGIPVAIRSIVHSMTVGNNSNPPVLSVTPYVVGDTVIGQWFQTSQTAPTITTSPVSGWTSDALNIGTTGGAVYSRYIQAASTSAHTMDSGSNALYVSMGITSQTGTAQVTSARTEAVVMQTNPDRRYTKLGAEAAISTRQRSYSRLALEAIVKRYFKGWGVPI